MTDNLKTYKFKRRRGIDDLRSEWAFRGNSQGDESVSNLLEDYINSKGWMSYNFGDVPLDQDSINQEVIRRKENNWKYIQQLKDEGKFGEEYELAVLFKPYPLFDL